MKYVDTTDEPHWVQLGIVHGSVGRCASVDFPGIYARLEDKDILDFIKLNAFDIITTTTTERPNMNGLVMIATGQYNAINLDDVEVLELDSISACHSWPAKYPIEVSRAVALKHDSKVTICGGDPLTSDCYSFHKNQWSLEAFKLEPARYGAMSAEIRPGEWLVMGGYDGTNALTDTKLLKNGVFTQGPDLPEPIYYGSCVMINETHLLVAAARYQYHYPNESPRNYLLDVNSKEWTQILDRTFEPYAWHSSGRFWNSTANEIQVAVIGHSNGIEVYSPRDETWHQFPSNDPLFGSVAIQHESDSFLLIGGHGGIKEFSGDIYKFDETGLSIIKENVLKVQRAQHVAMLIDEDYFYCNPFYIDS